MLISAFLPCGKTKTLRLSPSCICSVFFHSMSTSEQIIVCVCKGAFAKSFRKHYESVHERSNEIRSAIDHSRSGGTCSDGGLRKSRYLSLLIIGSKSQQDSRPASGALSSSAFIENNSSAASQTTSSSPSLHPSSTSTPLSSQASLRLEHSWLCNTQPQS